MGGEERLAVFVAWLPKETGRKQSGLFHCSQLGSAEQFQPNQVGQRGFKY